MKPGTVILAKGNYLHKDSIIKQADLFEKEDGVKFFYTDINNLYFGENSSEKVNDNSYYCFKHGNDNFVKTKEGIHCSKCEIK